MAFACRICKDNFNLTKFLTSDSPNISEGFSVVSTQCGHLFHLKCLEGALTNQKLLHARHGTGPLRRFCPVTRCNTAIPSEESLIKISFSNDGDENGHEQREHNSQEAEGKLVRRLQLLKAEKEKMMESLEKAENEAEIYRSAFEQIRLDLSDIQSFLKDDYQMRKGDLIFWVTRDGTYAPGKILEIRKKPGENTHYAIVKLDHKTKVSGIGPHAVNRDTLILPLTDLITFKSFFSNFFDRFQAAFEALRVDLNSEIHDVSFPIGSQTSTTERTAAYYRSTRKISKSISKLNIGNPTLNSLDELDSVPVESVPVSAVQTTANTASRKVARSRTIHYGESSEPRRLEKCRSLSWATPPTINPLDSPSTSESSRGSGSFSMKDLQSSEADYSNTIEDSAEFIGVGERVIWFDTYSEFQQLGTVADVCEFTPCAIVKFDEHPIVKHQFQYRTVQLDELFPYNLASPEDKFRIAESYGKAEDFLENHKHIFSNSNDKQTSGSDYEKDINVG